MPAFSYDKRDFVRSINRVFSESEAERGHVYAALLHHLGELSVAVIFWIKMLSEQIESSLETEMS